MSELRIAQMLDGQLQSTDPFTQARAMYDQKQQLQPDQSLMMNNLFNPDQSQQQKMINPEQNQDPAQPKTSSLIGAMNSAPKSDFESSGVPRMLQKLGIDDKGLVMNQLGRVQLIARLQNKFGKDYGTNPDAMNALSAFDEAVNKTPMDNQKSLNAINSSGNRTLKALLGGA